MVQLSQHQENGNAPMPNPIALAGSGSWVNLSGASADSPRYPSPIPKSR
jgi:hypothetical protein